MRREDVKENIGKGGVDGRVVKKDVSGRPGINREIGVDHTGWRGVGGTGCVPVSQCLLTRVGRGDGRVVRVPKIETLE